MNSNDEKIGRLIAWSRTHLGFSVEDVAVELGVPASDILKMERGEQRPKPEQLLALSDLFRVQPSWFFPTAQDFKSTSRGEPDRDRSARHSVTGNSRLEVMVEDLRILIGRDFDADTLQRLIGVLRDAEQVH